MDAEGQRFLGIRAPVLRGLAREFESLPLRNIASMLDSPWHEAGALALLILVRHLNAAHPTGC